MTIRNIQIQSFAAIGALGALLAGCASPAPPPMQARLELTAPSCAAAADLARATAFPAAKDNKFIQSVELTEASPCVAEAGGKKSVYAVMALPAVNEDGIISVASVPRGETVFSPRVQLRDEHGAVTREIGRDAFLFNGTAIEAQVRRRAGERYLVILSDGESVGKTVEQIHSLRNTQTVSSGVVFMTYHTGAEANSRIVFAYNGQVVVRVLPMPAADKK